MDAREWLLANKEKLGVKTCPIYDPMCGETTVSYDKVDIILDPNFLYGRRIEDAQEAFLEILQEALNGKDS